MTADGRRPDLTTEEVVEVETAARRLEDEFAGSGPAAGINAGAATAMAEVGLDIASELPMPWTEEIARAADVVVTMGCGDACPLYPGKRYEDWDLTDPPDQPIEVVRTTRDEIDGRVRELIASLDVPARM
jgi:arsenate reductase (thioredoxin)